MRKATIASNSPIPRRPQSFKVGTTAVTALLTLMVAVPLVPEPPTVLLKEALLLSVPEVAVVGEVICTGTLEPAAIVAKVQVRRFPVMLQPDTAGLIDQLSPGFVGRLSVSVTPVAVPGPALLIVIV